MNNVAIITSLAAMYMYICYMHSVKINQSSN